MTRRADRNDVSDAERLYETTDATVWAELFGRVKGCHVDQATLTTWFANAIEVGRAEGYRRGYAHGERDASLALIEGQHLDSTGEW